MRAVLQRVSQASVTIAGEIKGQIDRGLLILLAVEEADTAEDIEWLSGKIVRLRIFPDDAGLMNRSVQDISGEILLISQFTLFASTKKGNRPSYLRSAKPEVAIPLYEQFKTRLAQDLGKPVATGEFGDACREYLTQNGVECVECGDLWHGADVDPRVDPAHFLGLDLSDAMVVETYARLEAACEAQGHFKRR